MGSLQTISERGARSAPLAALAREAHVWLVCPGAPADAANERALLSDDERRRCDALRDPRDRAMRQRAWAALRRGLSRYTGIAPADLRFVRSPRGRPELAGLPALKFNLTHTRGLSAFVVALGDCGIDVEWIDPDRDTREVAEDALAPDERAWLGDAPPADRPRRFYAAWTLKEAYVKALGVGLAAPFQEIAFSLPPAGRGPARALRLWRGDPARWRFVALRPGPELALSLALRAPGDGPDLRQICCFGASSLSGGSPAARRDMSSPIAHENWR